MIGGSTSISEVFIQKKEKPSVRLDSAKKRVAPHFTTYMWPWNFNSLGSFASSNCRHDGFLASWTHRAMSVLLKYCPPFSGHFPAFMLTTTIARKDSSALTNVWPEMFLNGEKGHVGPFSDVLQVCYRLKRHYSHNLNTEVVENIPKFIELSWREVYLPKTNATPVS